MKTKLLLLVAASLVLTPLFATAQSQPQRKVPKTASSGRSLTQDIVPLRPTPGSQPVNGRPTTNKARPQKRATPERAPVSEKERKIFEFHKKRAADGSATSQYEVGSRYLTGKGVEKNRVEALKWLEKSAKQGNKKAAQKLSFVKRTSPIPAKPVLQAKPGTKPAPKKK